MALNKLVSSVTLRKSLGIQSREAPLWILLNLLSALYILLEMYYSFSLVAFLLNLSQSLVWKIEFAVLIINGLNIAVHVAHFVYPAMGHASEELNDTQRRLLSVSKDDPAISRSPSKAASSSSGGARADWSTTPPPSPISADLSPLSWVRRPVDASPISPAVISSPSVSGSPPYVFAQQLQQSAAPSMHLSWNNSALSGDGSPLQSTLASSWSYQHSPSPAAHGISAAVSVFSPQQISFQNMSGSALNTSVEALRNKGPSVSLNSSTPIKLPDVSITNETSLDDYMSQYQQQESYCSRGNMSVDGSHGAGHSLWNQSSSLMESSFHSPRKQVYQLSVRAPADLDETTGADKESGKALTSVHHRTWIRLNVDQETLFQWTENLRIWLSKTIFVRLVDEIDVVNAGLKRHGLSDVQIGEVGLDKLRKSGQLVRDVPSLNAVMPFLSASTHQQYLVGRIRELSRGGCLQEFRWNSGGTFKEKPWEEHLPTDAAIVLHMFAAYLDARLPAHPSSPDGRTFNNRHVNRGSVKSSTAGTTTPSSSGTAAAASAAAADASAAADGRLVIRCDDVTPPHYSLMQGSQCIELAKGRNNLFHTLLLFLYMVRQHHSSMLDKIHIGRSGLNMLWIIES